MDQGMDPSAQLALRLPAGSRDRGRFAADGLSVQLMLRGAWLPLSRHLAREDRISRRVEARHGTVLYATG